MSVVEAGSDAGSECPDRDDNVLLPELDQELFLRLRRDDPSATEVAVSFEEGWFADDGIDWEGECDCIGNNSHLKELDLMEFQRDEYREERRTRNFEAFCRGLSMNTSIQCLQVECIFNDAFGAMYLPRFILGNRNIRRLDLSHCFGSPNQIRELVSALSSVGKKSRLQQFIFTSRELNPQVAEELIGALGHHKSLSKLVLEYMRGGIGRSGCVALGGLLMDPSNRLRTLELSGNKFDDECLGILGQGLTGSGTLKKLFLDRNDSKRTLGWKNFFRNFVKNGCSLEEVDISFNQIGDEVVVFINALEARFPLMKKLMIGNSCYTVRSYEALSIYLQSPNCSLETLDLSGCRQWFGDEALSNLSNALRRNSKLKNLDIADCLGGTPEGWRSFFMSVAANQSSGLVDISCGYCGITNGGIQDIRWELLRLKTLNLSGNNLSGVVLRRPSRMCYTLETLILTNNTLLGVLSLVELADILRDPHCSLKELRLNTKVVNYFVVDNFGNTHNTGGDNSIFAAFADALADNKTLEKLSFGEFDWDNFRSRDWDSLSTTLCNSASIPDTYTSNHTLNDAFTGYEMKLLRDAGGVASKVWRCLEWNKNRDKSKVARQKIIYLHFVTAINGNCFDAEYFMDTKPEIMPHLLAWAGGDSFGHSSLYELLRTFPSSMSFH